MLEAFGVSLITRMVALFIDHNLQLYIFFKSHFWSSQLVNSKSTFRLINADFIVKTAHFEKIHYFCANALLGDIAALENRVNKDLQRHDGWSRTNILCMIKTWSCIFGQFACNSRSCNDFTPIKSNRLRKYHISFICPLIKRFADSKDLFLFKRKEKKHYFVSLTVPLSFKKSKTSH